MWMWVRPAIVVAFWEEKLEFDAAVLLFHTSESLAEILLDLFLLKALLR
jgi:hypothetical protein